MELDQETTAVLLAAALVVKKAKISREKSKVCLGKAMVEYDG